MFVAATFILVMWPPLSPLEKTIYHRGSKSDSDCWNNCRWECGWSKCPSCSCYYTSYYTSCYSCCYCVTSERTKRFWDLIFWPNKSLTKKSITKYFFHSSIIEWPTFVFVFMSVIIMTTMLVLFVSFFVFMRFIMFAMFFFFLFMSMTILYLINYFIIESFYC